MKTAFYKNPIGYIVSAIMVIYTVYVFFFSRDGFVLSAVLTAAFILLTVFYSVYDTKSAKKYITNLNSSIGSEQLAGVSDFPLPCVICDHRGNITWYNERFSKEILEEDNVAKLSIKSFFPNYTYAVFCQKDVVETEYNAKKYQCFVTKYDAGKKHALCFYFLDVTYYKGVVAEYRDSRPFIMLIMVDNIEMLSRKLSDSKFALVSSGIESRIEDWLKDEKIVLKKTANGRFFVTGEVRTLRKFIDEKFNILSMIREYKYKDESFGATLSVGVGVGGNFSACEERAKKSLDMALGRGGDQVAIFSEEGYRYFGGVSNAYNDNSKVSPRQTSANIANVIKKYDKVIICGHKFSDFDAVGSAMGFCFFARSIGAEAYVVVDRETTLAGNLIDYAVANGFNYFADPETALEKCDSDTILAVVDTHRAQMIECRGLYEKAGTKIVIDHHRRSDDYIDDAEIFYHLPSPSSTSEMVSELIQYSTIQAKMPATVATALLSGIVLDTKDYVLKTSSRTFEAAAFLRENGADTIRVKKMFAVDSEFISRKNDLIKSAYIYKNAMIAETDDDFENIRLVCAKACDEMLNIDGVKMSFVAYSGGKEDVQISARSLGEENVQIIMEQLGGGGHNTMAAVYLKNISVSDAVRKLKTEIDKYYESK